jgi:hypothetical protein
MLLYHGSKQLLTELKPQQAASKDPGAVPADELLHAIYFTPEFKFTLAMGARPEGVTNIDNDKITFENPELFDTNEEIYVYEITSSEIPAANLKKVDNRQYAVIGLENLKGLAYKVYRAGELLKYYELTNWKEPGVGIDKR